MCYRELIPPLRAFPPAGNRVPAKRRPLFLNRGRSSGTRRFPGKTFRAPVLQSTLHALGRNEVRPQPRSNDSPRPSIVQRRSQTLYSCSIRSLPHLLFWNLRFTLLASRVFGEGSPAKSRLPPRFRRQVALVSEHLLPIQPKGHSSRVTNDGPNPCFPISSTTRNFRIVLVAGVRCVCYGFYAQKKFLFP